MTKQIMVGGVAVGGDGAVVPGGQRMAAPAAELYREQVCPGGGRRHGGGRCARDMTERQPHPGSQRCAGGGGIRLW